MQVTQLKAMLLLCLAALLIMPGSTHAAALLDARCSAPLDDVPFCRGVSTTATEQVLQRIRWINSMPPELLVARVGDGNTCVTRECIDSAKGVLCIALNGGVAASSVLDRALQVKGPSVWIDQFAMQPPLSGLAAVANKSLTAVTDSTTTPQDMTLPQETTADDAMFCLNGVASREHPPCFTQCVDIVTQACSRACLPSILPGTGGITYSRPLPCLLSANGWPSNPVCTMRAGEKYVVDIRMQPWAACYMLPFVVPDQPGATAPQVCAGRVPADMVQLDLSFDCVRTRNGLCDAGDTLPLSRLQDPYLQLTMALADYLQINPLYVHASAQGQWSTVAYPATINNNAPNRIVTAHFRIFTDGEEKLHKNQRLVALLSKEGPADWQRFLQQRLVLPEGATVQGVAGSQNTNAAQLSEPAWWLMLALTWLVIGYHLINLNM